jgi:hypothetical protein
MFGQSRSAAAAGYAAVRLAGPLLGMGSSPAKTPVRDRNRDAGYARSADGGLRCIEVFSISCAYIVR